MHDNLHNNAASLAFNVVTDPGEGSRCARRSSDPTNPQYALYDPALIRPLRARQHLRHAGRSLKHSTTTCSAIWTSASIYTQQVFALNTTGKLFSGFGAGDVQAAMGYEHRDELGHNLEPDRPESRTTSAPTISFSTVSRSPAT